MAELFPVSSKLFARAQKVIPGGVNSPVRAFRNVGMEPFYTQSADGCRLRTPDGNEFIDYVLTWGPAIFGHNDAEIRAAVHAAVDRGLGFGTNAPDEVRMAELLASVVPAVEKARMTNSGTEATMSALRLARGFTRRDKIVKFAGGYHGHVDALLVKAGSGAMTFGRPDSLGVTAGTAADTFVLPYNDFGAAEALFAARGNEIAAVIVEPFLGNVGFIMPVPGFLEKLRELTKNAGALLIFDEVMTGFRVSLQGTMGVHGVRPDLVCLGKIIGGGLPVGAFGGRADIMDCVAPLGGVYQAGTFCGHPVALAGFPLSARRSRASWNAPHGNAASRCRSRAAAACFRSFSAKSPCTTSKTRRAPIPKRRKNFSASRSKTACSFRPRLTNRASFQRRTTRRRSKKPSASSATASARSELFSQNSGRRESKTSVTGPSLTSETFIIAPKRPVGVGLPISAESAATNFS